MPDESRTPAPRGAADARIVLAVVAGPRAGSRVVLEPGRRVSIGYELDNEVVIRHRSIDGLRASLMLREEGIRLQVERGQADLLGVVVGEGQSVELPRLVPFSLGDAMLAVGPARGRGWTECRRLASRLAERRQSSAQAVLPLSRHAVSPDGDQAHGTLLAAPGERVLAAGLSARWARQRIPAARWASSRWPVPIVLGASLVAALSVVVLSSVSQAFGVGSASGAMDRLRSDLASQGHVTLVVESGAGDTPVVRGFVQTDAERARVADLVSRSGSKAFVDVTTGEQLVRQVSDVFRVNGLSAEVRHIGRGVVEATLREVDPDRVRRTEAAVRRDVPGLAGLKVQSTAATPRPVARGPLVPDDPGKRVVSVSYGPRGHVVTADGARYFVGAILPTGHRIVRIDQGEVELQRDGETTRLAI
jgi:type III secretion protein D